MIYSLEKLNASRWDIPMAEVQSKYTCMCKYLMQRTLLDWGGVYLEC